MKLGGVGIDHSQFKEDSISFGLFINSTMQKSIVALACSLCITLTCFGQDSFEEGYFIASGQRISCLINNQDWSRNPTEFEYRMSSASEIKINSIDRVEEFGVDGFSRYIRSTVAMDMTTGNVNYMANTSEIRLDTVTVFLKTLVEGSFSLYEYNRKGLYRLFIKKDGGDFEQLLYNDYRYETHQVKTVNSFRVQLLNALSCECIDPAYFMKLSFGKKPITKVLLKYFDCFGEEPTQYGVIPLRERIHAGVNAGFQISQFSVEHGAHEHRNASFAPEQNAYLGLEFELVFPFNRQAWSVVLAPNYQQYHEELPEVYPNVGTIAFDYQSIEIPVVVRRSFPLQRFSRWYTQAGFVLDQPLENYLDYEWLPDEGPGNKTGFNVRFGGGIEMRNGLNLEVNVGTPRDLLSNRLGYHTRYSTLSATIGYNFF